jgi:Domain of unknown function (DUF4190)
VSGFESPAGGTGMGENPEGYSGPVQGPMDTPPPYGAAPTAPGYLSETGTPYSDTAAYPVGAVYPGMGGPQFPGAGPSGPVDLAGQYVAGYPQGYPYPGGYPYAPAYNPQSGSNGMSIAALVCGICGFIYGIPAVLGIIFGCISLSQIKRTGQQGRGMAIAGIVLGILWLVLGIIVVVAIVAFVHSNAVNNGFDNGYDNGFNN